MVNTLDELLLHRPPVHKVSVEDTQTVCVKTQLAWGSATMEYTEFA